MSGGTDVPRPTVRRDDAAGFPASIPADSLQTVLDVVGLQREARRRLQDRRAERFARAESVFDVDLADVVPHADLALLPGPSRVAITTSEDDRWRLAYRAIVLGGYPPGHDGGRCSREEALALLEEDAMATDRTVSAPAETVEQVRLDDGTDGIEIALADGRERIRLSVDGDSTAALESADLVHLTTYSSEALATVRSLGEAFAETPGVTVAFEPAVPRRTYGSRAQGLGDLVPASVYGSLRDLSPVPGSEAVEGLETALREGPFTVDEQLAIARLLAGDADAVSLRYGTDVPRLVGEIARLAGVDLVAIPQRGEVLLTEKSVPDSVANLAASFPERQRLNDAHREAIDAVLKRPTWAVARPTSRDEGQVAEALADRVSDGRCSPEAAFYHETSPWTPRPEADALDADRRCGSGIVSELRAFDERHGVELAAIPLGTLRERAIGDADR